MKNLFSIIAGIGLLTVTAQAQFSFGPRPGEATTITPATPALIVGSTLSNITATIANPFRITSSGNIGLYFLTGCSNASTARTLVYFQTSQDGVNWTSPLANNYAAAVQNGTSPSVTFTNFATSAAFQNHGWIRVQSISNAHASSLWITNLTFYQH